MRTPAALTTTLAGALALALLAGCGKKDADDVAEDTATATAGAASAPEAGAATAPASPAATAALVAVADIDRWQRGMEAELRAVQEAEAKLKTARSGNDTLTLMMDATDMGTVGEGARAAGVSEDRYRRIQGTLSALAANLTPYESEMSTKDMPRAMLDEVKKGREASVARMSADVEPGVVDALRARAVELRKQDLALAGARLKAAGAAR